MQASMIYEDIAKRTGGDVYIGVVGPVRTGKSTFIHRLLDSLVIPNIESDYDRKRALDEAPQSASGKTVMTTEPKFIPDEAVSLTMDDGVRLRVRMIDCVGYVIDGAITGEEEGKERMVMTPWSDKEMPFEEAAELGTSKVISEHSTIGILVTTDGTVTDLPREAYIDAEERVVKELSELGKPFAIVLNSRDPGSEDAKSLARELEEKYGAPVALVNCRELNADDIREILGLVLSEFPVTLLRFNLPEWCSALPEGHPVISECMTRIKDFSDMVEKLGDVSRASASTDGIVLTDLCAGDGVGILELPVSKEKYYAAISDTVGIEIGNERQLFSTLAQLGETKRRYDRVSSALRDAEEKGYGIVMPTPEELKLDEPRLSRQAGGFGVRMTATADSIHMIKAGIKTDLCPVIGTEEQSLRIKEHLKEKLEDDPSDIWNYEVFGRSLFELARDGLESKIAHMSDESREKMGETLERIINEGANGLICILL